MEQVLEQTQPTEQPFNPNKSQGIAIPTAETTQTQTPTAVETQPVELNQTLVNAQPVAESTPLKTPNITPLSDHPLPFGTTFESLQAKVNASQAETKQVLLPPQQPTTETPATSITDKVKGWFKFGRK